MAPRKIPMRTCVGCRTVRAKRELVRVVRTPAGDVTVDPTGKLSGRGAYVLPNLRCLDLALQGKRLERALQQPIPPDVQRRMAEMLSGADREPRIGARFRPGHGQAGFGRGRLRACGSARSGSSGAGGHRRGPRHGQARHAWPGNTA